MQIFTARDLVITVKCKLHSAFLTISHYSSNTDETASMAGQQYQHPLATLCLAIFCINLELGSVSQKIVFVKVFSIPAFYKLN